MHGLGKQFEQQGGLEWGHGSFRQPLREIAAIDKLEREERTLRIFTDRVDRDDVGMPQLRDRTGLEQEPVDLAGRREPGPGDRLDRHDPAQPVVAGQVNDPHSTSTNLAEDFVTGENRQRIAIGCDCAVRRLAQAHQPIELLSLCDPFADLLHECRLIVAHRFRRGIVTAQVGRLPAHQAFENHVLPIDGLIAWIGCNRLRDRRGRQVRTFPRGRVWGDP